MKQAIAKAQKAKIKQAKYLIENIGHTLSSFEEDGLRSDGMQYLRDDSEALLQCTHEISAYQNILELKPLRTENPPSKHYDESKENGE